MIFTVALKEVFDEYIERVGASAVRGQGGTVWETFEEACWYIQFKELRAYDVYKVDADWDDREVVGRFPTDGRKARLYRALKKPARVSLCTDHAMPDSWGVKASG